METKGQQTPLQISFDEFGEVFSKGILVICIITWVINMAKFKPVRKGKWLLVAISFSVVAIPEGLLVVVTTTLSIGINQMAKQKAIVTIPEGNLKSGKEKVQNREKRSAFQANGKVASRCNELDLDRESKAVKRNGEPTEAAFKVLPRRSVCRRLPTMWGREEATDGVAEHGVGFLTREVPEDAGAYEVILEQCDRYLNATGEVLELDWEFWGRLDAVREKWAGGKNCFGCPALAYKNARVTTPGTSRTRSS
jgi:hypothetical protein